MTVLAKGLLLGAIQTAMMLSIGGKLLIDRARLPKLWVRAAPFDPSLPIRGRYVRLSVNAEVRDLPDKVAYQQVVFSVEEGKLIARPDKFEGTGVSITQGSDGTPFARTPIAYFIPEHVPDPSVRSNGEELWVEVTVPHKGPPRPIRLGVKKDGVLTPLALN